MRIDPNCNALHRRNADGVPLCVDKSIGFSADCQLLPISLSFYSLVERLRVRSHVQGVMTSILADVSLPSVTMSSVNQTGLELIEVLCFRKSLLSSLFSTCSEDGDEHWYNHGKAIELKLSADIVAYFRIRINNAE